MLISVQQAHGTFFLQITSPEQSEVIVDTQTVIVAGNTSVGTALSVGNSFIEVGLDGSFETTIELEDDINIVEVVASIPTGEQFSEVITIIYAP